MDELEIDFEGTQQTTQNSGASTDNQDKTTSAVNQDDVTSLGGSDIDDVNKKTDTIVEENTKNEKSNSETTSSTGELFVGDKLEIDGATYTVAENGNIVNEKGEVFKEAKDVAEWLKSVEVSDDTNDKPLTLASIQEELGVTITDDKGNNVNFTNDAAGVKSYIESVIAVRSQELQEAAINRLYQDNPLLKQFQDYVKVNGTPRGFAEIPDRSGIELDKDNEQQLMAVIRMAAQEFGNKSINDNYLKYLRDRGELYDEAKLQLNNLIEKDKVYRKDIETKAAKQRAQEAKDIAEYWANVNKVITGRVINGYRIPESFTKEIDGKKTVITPNDFFDYVSRPIIAENGEKFTGYQRDLAKLSDDEYLNREMLDAWLMFTGGTYKDLIDMAVKEDKVRQLRVKSKEIRSSKAVKIVKAQRKSSIDDIIL